MSAFRLTSGSGRHSHFEEEEREGMMGRRIGIRRRRIGIRWKSIVGENIINIIIY